MKKEEIDFFESEGIGICESETSSVRLFYCQCGWEGGREHLEVHFRTISEMAKCPACKSRTVKLHDA